MEFLLIWDWADEKFGLTYQQLVDSFRAKAEKEYDWQVGIGRLILSPAIGYSWADIERLF